MSEDDKPGKVLILDNSNTQLHMLIRELSKRKDIELVTLPDPDPVPDAYNDLILLKTMKPRNAISAHKRIRGRNPWCNQPKPKKR
jgi:hypothetical protein